MDAEPTAPPAPDATPDDRPGRLEALESGHAETLARLGEIAAALRVIGAKLDAKADAATLERVGGEVAGALKVIGARLDAKADAAALERVGGEIRAAFGDLRGALLGKASAADVADLKGEVGRLQGALKGTGALVALVVGALGAAAALAYALVNYLRP